MIELLVAAAAIAGTAVVGAAATDAWQFARDGVVGFFRRDSDAAAEKAAARLDQDVAKVEAAAPEDREKVRAGLASAWQTRLEDLLQDHPELADELQDWAGRVREKLPPAQQQWVQNNTASGQGAVVYGVQGGNQAVYNYGPGAPPPGSSAAPEPLAGDTR